jgi:hypothetical protein
MKSVVKQLGSAAVLALFLMPLAAQAQRGKLACITDAELDAVIRPQIESGAQLIDTSMFDYRRYLCTGGSIAGRIHKMREDYHPEERAERQDREERVRADIARLAAQDQERLDMRDEAERLEALARIADARREAAEADAGTREAQLREARAARALAALPPAQRVHADILITGNRDLDAQLDAVVQEDSQSWMANHYQPGSMHDSSFVRVSRANSDYVALGYFQYTDGGEGSVSVRYHRGRVDCLEFQDQPGVCRQLGNSLSQQNVAGIANHLFWAVALKAVGL